MIYMLRDKIGHTIFDIEVSLGMSGPDLSITLDLEVYSRLLLKNLPSRSKFMHNMCLLHELRDWVKEVTLNRQSSDPYENSYSNKEYLTKFVKKTIEKIILELPEYELSLVEAL